MSLDTLTALERAELIADIAGRRFKAGALARMYECTVAELRRFTEEHRGDLEDIASKATEQTSEPTPLELEELWLSSKTERLRRYQVVADSLFAEIQQGSRDPTSLREFRSYLLAAANELGQLLHRGAGDANAGDTLAIEIPGVDMESLK